MAPPRVHLHREQETMLFTLYLHARDARSAQPVLGDAYAADVLDRVDYDFDRLDKIAGNLPAIMWRAKTIDDIARRFLARHHDAVVLHLGCGLDSRVQRLNPPPTVSWFDVDQEPVIDLRRRIVGARPATTMIATSVVEPGWWKELPGGRPTLIVGEGLLMYLSPADVATVVDMAVSGIEASCQTLVFDTVAPWVARVSGWQPNNRAAGIRFSSTTAHLAEAMRAHRDVRLVDDVSVVALAGAGTPGALGCFIGLVNALPAGHRAITVHTYTR